MSVLFFGISSTGLFFFFLSFSHLIDWCRTFLICDKLFRLLSDVRCTVYIGSLVFCADFFVLNLLILINCRLLILLFSASKIVSVS